MGCSSQSKVKLLVDGILFHEFQHLDEHATTTGVVPGVAILRLTSPEEHAWSRESTVRVVISPQGQPDLLQVILAGHLAGCFASS